MNVLENKKKVEHSDAASSSTKYAGKSYLKDKKNLKVQCGTTIGGGTIYSRGLNEKLIKEVVRRIVGVCTTFPTDHAALSIKGITKSPFASWIDREEKLKDFNLPMLEKYKGKGDLMSHLLHFKLRMSLNVVFEALTCNLFATTLFKKALSWFSQLPKGSIQSFEYFGRTFLEQYHKNRSQQKSMANLHLKQRYDESL